jgi:carbamoyl-phosphate synthase small subunit
VRGLVVRAHAENPSNYRALMTLDRWLKRHNIPGISGIDTRKLTARIRETGMPHGVIAHSPEGRFDFIQLRKQAQEFPGLVGLDLAKEVTCRQMFHWEETPWVWNKGYGKQTNPSWRAVVVDYGVKRNILRLLAGSGAEITVLPAQSTTEDVLRHKPHGVLLSNGPGRSGGDGRLCHSDDPWTDRCGYAAVRDLLGASNAGFGARRQHAQNGAGTSRREPSGEGSGDRQGRDRLDESRLHGGSREPAARREGDACVAVRRHQLRDQGREPARFSRCSIIPKHRPGPMDSHYLFDRFAAASKQRA